MVSQWILFSRNDCDIFDKGHGRRSQLIKIHSQMRANFNWRVDWVPSHTELPAVQIACEKVSRRVGAGTGDPPGAWSIIKTHIKGNASKIEGLREAAVGHQG